MLEIEHLSLQVKVKHGWVEAVDRLSLRLEKGKTLGLVGESGCGKSLTAQAVLRLAEDQGVRRTHGDVKIDGVSVFGMNAAELRQLRGGRVAMIFQEPMTALNPVFSIAQHLYDVLRQHSPLRGASAKDKALSLLGDVGLRDGEALLKKYPSQLSGGMRQRVLIAMALAGEPDYLLADEPTTALDVSVQKRMIALLRSLQKERGLGLLLVTHDFGLIAELADQVAVMYAGQLIEQTDVYTLFKHAKHPYTQALLQCRPESADQKTLLNVADGQVPLPGEWPSGCHFAPRCRYVQQACLSTAIAWQAQQHACRCLYADELKV